MDSQFLTRIGLVFSCLGFQILIELTILLCIPNFSRYFGRYYMIIEFEKNTIGALFIFSFVLLSLHYFGLRNQLEPSFSSHRNAGYSYSL